MLFAGFNPIEGAWRDSLYKHLPAIRHSSLLVVRNRYHLNDAVLEVNIGESSGTNLNRLFMSHDAPPVNASAATKSSSDGAAPASTNRSITRISSRDNTPIANSFS